MANHRNNKIIDVKFTEIKDEANKEPQDESVQTDAPATEQPKKDSWIKRTLQKAKENKKAIIKGVVWTLSAVGAFIGACVVLEKIAESRGNGESANGEAGGFIPEYAPEEGAESDGEAAEVEDNGWNSVDE